jgi:uridine kinase
MAQYEMVMTDSLRQGVIRALGTSVTALKLGHPTRVAIEGRSAAGKSTLSDELAEAIESQGRIAIRASIDDFHRPGHKYRSQRRDWTPESYYAEGYDYQAFRDLLLQPLGPGGDRRFRAALFDSFHDVAFPEHWEIADSQSIALIDGAFLLRPELADHWDYVIWLDIDFETMIARARKRDSAWVGSEEVVAERYRHHWIPTHERYERLESPRERADVIVDNRDLERPRLIFPYLAGEQSSQQRP